MTDKLAVMLSGGIDAFVAAKWRQEFGGIVKPAVFVNYGQPSAIAEAKCAILQAAYLHLDLQHLKARLPVANLFASVCSDDRGRASTYVPHRNLVLASLAASHLEGLGVTGLIFGWHAQDEAYPDCTLAFQGALMRVLSEGSGRAWSVYAPLQNLTKRGVVKLGLQRGLPLQSMTWSCYRNAMTHCGECPSCRQRQEGFGPGDSTLYLTHQIDQQEVAP